MRISKASEFAEYIKHGPYTFPGMYPVFFITSDGAALSFDAAEDNADLIKESIENYHSDGWRVIGVYANFEEELYCDHTGERIESAYCED
jgi:hypothetical protein